jgi:hypothetical protein
MQTATVIPQAFSMANVLADESTLTNSGTTLLEKDSGTTATKLASTLNLSAKTLILPSSIITQTGQASASSLQTITGGGAESDLDSMTLTLTTGANPCLIIFNARFSCTASGGTNTGYFAINIGGTNRLTFNSRSVSADTNGDSEQISISYIYTPSAGSNTFKIRVRALANNYYITNRILQVIELKY